MTISRPAAPEAALAEFRAIVGDDHTLTTTSALERYHWCTSPIQRQIAAALRPATVEEVQQIVRAASTHQVPLYPISTGNNWGYGSALPVEDHSVIVDLGRMNNIVEVNTELAYAVVEPGVTQRQLYEHLRDRGIPLWMNPTGAGPECSILGNTLERGFGIGPNGDHFLAQCGMEVVLPNGQILKTGFGHFPGAKATYLYKWGVGPYLDGLFTQSNYGIVTKIGVWLKPEPEHFEACYFTCESEDGLGALIESVRELMFSGCFQGPVNLLHRNRVLLMLGQYPWDQMEGRTPLSEPVAQTLARTKNIGAWNGVGAICGSRFQVRAHKRTIRRVLRRSATRITFLSDARLAWLQRFPAVASTIVGMNVSELLRTLQASYGLMKGIPTEIALSLSYWRHRRMKPPATGINPARDKCGLMWFAPIIPMTGRDVLSFREIIEPILAKYRFDACMTLTAVNERCFDCTLPLLFDRDNPAEERDAQQCYQELVQACETQGYIPYRLGLQSMRDDRPSDDAFWAIARDLKRVLDPQGILAPGRYVG